METTNRRRIISSIIIFLLIVNLAGLGTLLYHKFSGHHGHKECAGKGCKAGDKDDDKMCFNDFIKKDLNLSKKQEEDFMLEKKNFHDLARKYMDSVEMGKTLIFDEMLKEKPDMKVLEANNFKSIAYFSTLKQKTTEHFLNIKAIFTPEQSAKYFKFIKEKSCCMEGMGPKGEGCKEGNPDKCKDKDRPNCSKESVKGCPGEKEMGCPEHKAKQCPGNK